MKDQESYYSQLRLLLEELCCDICRFEHVHRDEIAHEDIRIDREFQLASSALFADVRVAPRGLEPYFVEVKHGYPNDMLLRHMLRKYGEDGHAARFGSRVIIVIDLENRPEWAHTLKELRRLLNDRVAVDVWDERDLIQKLKQCFKVEISAVTAENLLDVRQAIDKAKVIYAFGATSNDNYDHDPLKAELLWHFDFWKLRRLRELGSLTPRGILPPGLYRRVAVLLADLCGFSSYVRDTSDPETVRECLTAFYSKARYQILNNGGMMYQFVGDEVIGIFGLPDRQSDSATRALEAVRSLISVGNSVSHHWQRRIDRLQTSGGLHVGMAIGDLQIVSLRPFSRTHMGAIGDCINIAARVMSMAGPNEIMVTNRFYQELTARAQADFQEIEPIEARNVGRITGWKLDVTGTFEA